MWVDNVINNLSKNKTYNRLELFELFKKENAELNANSFGWLIYNLQKDDKLYRIEYDSYSIVKPKDLRNYHPLYSKEANNIKKYLDKKFPELSYTIFETVLLNEFLNHQVVNNTIYIQVEKDLSAYIFEDLRNTFKGNFLYKPNRDEFNRYWIKDIVVIIDLKSQSPLSQESPHEIVLEKMMVDIVSDKSISCTFSTSELPSIFDSIVKKYKFDSKKLNRYATRRGREEAIKKLLEASR